MSSLEYDYDRDNDSEGAIGDANGPTYGCEGGIPVHGFIGVAVGLVLGGCFEKGFWG
jgi:hypothetical protein